MADKSFASAATPTLEDVWAQGWGETDFYWGRYNFGTHDWQWDHYYQDGSAFAGGPEEPPDVRQCEALEARLESANCGEDFGNMPNGCGAAGQEGIVPQSVPGMSYISLTNSCNDHDRCYGVLTPSVSPIIARASCDSELETQILWQCNHEDTGNTMSQDCITEGHLENSANAECVMRKQQQCRGWANGFHSAVILAGEPAFHRAQKTAACTMLA